MDLIEELRLPSDKEIVTLLEEKLMESKSHLGFMLMVEDRTCLFEMDVDLVGLNLRSPYNEGLLVAEEKNLAPEYTWGVDNLYKSIVITRLLRDKKVDTRELQRDIFKYYGRIDGEIFNHAVLMINEYCTNDKDNSKRTNF